MVNLQQYTGVRIMSGKLVFVTGGGRSGKSAFALRQAELLPGPKLFVATGTASDAEMAERIRRHRQERGPEWQCLEVPISKACTVHELMDLAVLPRMQGGSCNFAAVLVDCLSTWVSACQDSWLGAPRDLENGVKEAFRDFLEALGKFGTPVFIVSAEVGLGLVPLHPEARQFADILGHVNQMAAAEADEAYFCVSGIPVRIK